MLTLWNVIFVTIRVCSIMPYGEDITMYLNLELRTNTNITNTHVMSSLVS